MNKKISISNIITFLKPDFIHQDHRGSLVQLVSGGWKQINFNTSFAGTVRGGHHHKNNREAFFVASGKFNLKLKNGENIVEFLMEKEDFFVIEKNVSHSFEFVEDTLLIALYDIGVIEKSATNQNQIDMYQDVW
ncbi:MAG: cupin domain-containing protein [Pseudomonadota bacterium]